MAKATLRLDDLEMAIFSDLPSEKIGVVFQMLCHHFPIRLIKTDGHYQAAKEVVVRIALLLNENKIEDKKVLAEIFEYLETLSSLVEAYEKEKFSNIGKKVEGYEMLAYLMELNHLKQVDLQKELGGQSVVSNILSGKRELNLKQIRALSKRFHVSPLLFV